MLEVQAWSGRKVTQKKRHCFTDMLKYLAVQSCLLIFLPWNAAIICLVMSLLFVIDVVFEGQLK